MSRQVQSKGDVHWFMPGAKRPFAYSTKATSDVIEMVAEDYPNVTITEVIGMLMIRYEPEANKILMQVQKAGYGDETLADYLANKVTPKPRKSIRLCPVCGCTVHTADVRQIGRFSDTPKWRASYEGAPLRSSKISAASDACKWRLTREYITEMDGCQGMVWVSKSGLPVRFDLLAEVDPVRLRLLYVLETAEGHAAEFNKLHDGTNKATVTAWKAGFLNPRSQDSGEWQ